MVLLYEYITMHGHLNVKIHIIIVQILEIETKNMFFVRTSKCYVMEYSVGT